MKIVYLDQNKWIDLARAVKDRGAHPELFRVLEALVTAANARRVAIPLSSTNIYETHKISDPERRAHLAWVQATLSQGRVFRGRHKRLEVEVIDVLRTAYGLPTSPREPNWFLSDVFFEDTLEWDDPRHAAPISERVVDKIRSDPPRFLFEYLVGTPENVRATGVQKFSDGSRKLIESIEKRRALHASESMDMRRRIQGVLLITSEQDLIASFIAKAQIPGQTETDVIRDQCQRIVTDAPTYNIEREVVVRLEAQKSRAANENDLRDMQAFCSVIAYADIIVAENFFSSLAKQARLDKQYNTTITTKLLELPKLLEDISSEDAVTTSVNEGGAAA